MSQMVFTDPNNRDARALAARALEQLGYVAESATWRNAYLLGAQELRGGPGTSRRSPGVAPDMLHVMTLEQVFDHLGTRLNGPRAGTTQIVVEWRFSDTKQSVVSTLSHGALTAVVGKDVATSDATVTLTRPTFESVVLGRRTFSDAVRDREIAVNGDATRVMTLWSLFDDFDAAFPVVEPRR